MRLLIDGDSLIYKGACAAEKTSYRLKYDDGSVEKYNTKKEALAAIKPGKHGKLVKVKSYKDEKLAKWYTKKALDKILGYFEEGTDYIFFMSPDKGNFRDKVATTVKYKANRPAKPKHYQVCKDYLKQLVGEHLQVHEGCEADDMLSIYGRKYPEDLMVHIDKDILQVPGHHFNPDQGVLYEITELQGLQNLYTQLIIGDSTDNIPGLKMLCKPRSCGPKKVEDALGDCRLGELVFAVRDHIYNNRTYNNDGSQDWQEIYEKLYKEMYSLVHLLETEEELKEIQCQEK